MQKSVKLSKESFSEILSELLSGPTTAIALAEASGMTPRYVNKLMATMHRKKVAHIAGYEADKPGRKGGRIVWALGHGKDASREKLAKPRAQVNRDYRMKKRMEALKGTPFYGLSIGA